MTLHKNRELFEQAVRFTSQKMQIPEIYIEKDYWVSYILHTIYHNPVGSVTVFKGGTALSKCFKLIDRFSEDLDFVVLKNETETANQLTNKIKKVSRVVSDVLPEVPVEEVTRKMGMNRKTAHQYDRLFSGEFGQVRDVVIVEATWYGCFEPYTQKDVVTFIHDMMIDTGQSAMIKEYSLAPFPVNVLVPTRTMCEKIMSLVRFSYTDTPVDDLKKKIRHLYDLYQILQDSSLNTFYKSRDFDTMLLKVGHDDFESFRNNNDWLKHHPVEALLFKKSDEVWKELAKTYTGVFSNLVFGVLPDPDLILSTVKRIKNRIAGIQWNI